MTSGIEVEVATRLFAIFGEPLLLGLFTLGLFIFWMIVVKMDRVGIVFIGFSLTGILMKMGLIPIFIYGAAIIAAALVWAISFTRGIGDQ